MTEDTTYLEEELQEYERRAQEIREEIAATGAEPEVDEEPPSTDPNEEKPYDQLIAHANSPEEVLAIAQEHGRVREPAKRWEPRSLSEEERASFLNELDAAGNFSNATSVLRRWGQSPS